MTARYLLFCLILPVGLACRAQEAPAGAAVDAAPAAPEAAAAAKPAVPAPVAVDGIPPFHELPGELIPVYRTISEKPNQEYGYVPGPLLRRVPDGTGAVRLASFNRGFEADSVAEQLRFADGSVGWVDVRHVYLPYRTVAPSSFHSGSNLAAPADAVLEKGTVLAAQTFAFDYKGLDPGDGIPVRLADGRSGYVTADADARLGGATEMLATDRRIISRERAAVFAEHQ